MSEGGSMVLGNVEKNRSWNFDFAAKEKTWSGPWGSPDAQWRWAIYPRISNFLPTQTILEIAPGFGRWTEYLRKYCEKLIIVDMNEKCIEGCKQRFGETNIEYYVNDGRSLEMVKDDSIDFVFSFDSMVHVDEDVLRAYLNQLAKKLRANGGGFFHHSNLGEYRAYFSIIRKIRPALLKDFLIKSRIIDSDHGRDGKMSLNAFDDICRMAGLRCIVGERINWIGCRVSTDCLSTFVRLGSRYDGDFRSYRNRSFMKEANLIKRLDHIYQYCEQR